MLSKNYTLTAVYAKKELKYAIDCYRKRLNLLTCYRYNIAVQNPMIIYDRIIDIQERMENLMILDNIINTALCFLKPVQKDVIIMSYQNCLDKYIIMDRLNLTLSNYKYVKRQGLKKLSVFLFNLGLTDKNFLKMFNDEPYIIRNYEEAIENIRKLKNLSGKRKTEESEVEDEVGL